jgi:pyridoxine/pyridoxamine 5'-phosphate oxidase
VEGLFCPPAGGVPALLDGGNPLEYLSPAEVACPEDWGGYRVVPSRVEFWQGRESRLHDRIVYARSATGWSLSRLGP